MIRPFSKKRRRYGREALMVKRNSGALGGTKCLERNADAQLKLTASNGELMEPAIADMGV